MRMAEARKLAEAQRAGQAKRAADEATRAWGKYSTAGDCDYLAEKGIQAHGVKFTHVPEGATHGQSLVIPMTDVQGRIHGLQFIFPKGHPKRAKTGRNKDFWPAGLAKAGHFHQIGVVRDLVLVAEGYATAATLFEATGLPVAVAFDAGNLQPVAVALDNRHKNVRILVCADDDFQTEGNPGVAKAAAAALAVGGAWIAPAFSVERAAKLTDFNDLAQLEGSAVVSHQITQRLADLGWNRAPAAPKPQPGGEGNPAEEDLRPIETAEEMQERFSLIYEMKGMVFDHQERALLGLDSMRNACTSRQTHRQWMESSTKHIVRTREVGFDPTGKDDTIKCNLFGGLPAIGRIGAAARQLETLEYQCSYEGNPHLFQYVLRHLALPLQHLGAKMTTAILLHGPQGVGKNIIFERTMLGIYGQYGAIVGQEQIDSKHNRWQSKKLYMFCDEVMTRAELYQNKNKVKGMITSDWITINPKGVDEYMERNHCNFVFASNEIQPLILERDDRRFTVIWTPPKLGGDFYADVGAEQRDGGIAAFRNYLEGVALGDHTPHTAPLMTKAKEDLIALGMDSVERFWVEWINKHLPLPVCICKSEDFYAAYRWWCGQNGISKPAQANTLLANSAKRPGAQKLRKRFYADAYSSATVQAMLMYPPGADEAADIRAITDSVLAFTGAIEDWKGDSNVSPAIRRVK
jgi:putative DNA primase/helicase